MAIHILRGTSDQAIEAFIEAIRPYEADHPCSRIEIYRQDPVSVRVRIIDPDFGGRSRVDRHETVWRYFDILDDETQADLSSLILLTPDETAKSLANFVFDDPVPSDW